MRGIDANATSGGGTVVGTGCFLRCGFHSCSSVRASAVPCRAANLPV